ncbi:MAG: clan AA aspartic protease [Planctomycetes bacterium]|nr:clan AA aspartic protease [Planctomycetota bacterium]
MSIAGSVDAHGRALVQITIRADELAIPHTIDAWIDTGFNGDLVLPQSQVDRIGLTESGTVKAVLADGSEIALSRYACFVDWFGAYRELEVVANDGQMALLGVGLLIGRDLQISYRSGAISIT